MVLSTTVKRKFLNQKLRELGERGFSHEYKAVVDFWTKRITRQKYPCDFVYVCGQQVVRFRAMGYEVIDTPEFARKVVSTLRCYAIRIEKPKAL